MITTIRPTVSMVTDLLPDMKETWIFNDCAIGERKSGGFVGLVVVRLDGYDELYYGYVRRICACGSLRSTREKLDLACKNFQDLPAKAFAQKVDWGHVRIGEGRRYCR